MLGSCRLLTARGRGSKSLGSLTIADRSLGRNENLQIINRQNMPRPRLSHDQAKMKGSLAVNKGRFADRKDSPSATGKVGLPPKYFSSQEKAVWKEIAKAIPAGVAGGSDRMVIEMASRLLHQFRTDPVMQSSRLSLLMQLLSRLGLDPQARTRLQIEQPKETTTDEWSDLTTPPVLPTMRLQ